MLPFLPTTIALAAPVAVVQEVPGSEWVQAFWQRWQPLPIRHLAAASWALAQSEPVEAGSTSVEAAQVPGGGRPPLLPIEVAWPAIDHALFRAVTRPIPAGLSATRRAEREAERQDLSAALAAALDGEQGAEWHAFLDERLRYFQDEPQVWIALAEVIVDLERYDLAPALSVGLGAGAPVAGMAADCLAHLYGKEFESVEAFEAFIDGLVLDAPTLRLLDQLRAERARARESRVALFAYDKSLALEALESADRKLRLGAALALDAELRGGGAKIDPLAPALIARVAVEDAPEVAEVIIDGLADTLEGRTTGGPVVEGLREVLAERASSDPFGQRLVIARALAQLPWPGADASAPDALERGAELIAGLLEGPGDAALDPDVTLGVLQALNSLSVATSANPAAAKRLEGTGLGKLLVGLAFDDTEDLSARVVAVGILPRVAPTSTLGELVALVCAPVVADTASELPTSLRFAALGAMGRFAARADATAFDLAPLVNCLIEHTERPEADLRNLALELLGDGALAAHLEGKSVAPFVERLGVETDPAVIAKLIALMGKYGTAADLSSFIELANFDALAARDLPSDANVAGLIRDLADGDGELTLSGAMRLWSVADERGLWARREAALGLIAGLDVDAAAALSADHHRTVVEWAQELRSAGVPLATLPGGASFLNRLVGLHLAKSSTGDGFGLAEQNLWGALFLADAARADVEGEDTRGEIRAKFARAEEEARSRDDQSMVFAVLGARARYLVGAAPRFELDAETGQLAHDLGTALDDFEVVFASDHASNLDATDLRAAGELAAKRGLAADGARALAFSLALVGLPSWHKEPLAVRVVDLDALAQRAIASGTPDEIRAALASFDALPREMGLAETVQWDSATLDRASWTTLRGAVSTLEAALPPEVAEEPPADGEADAVVEAPAVGAGEAPTETPNEVPIEAPIEAPENDPENDPDGESDVEPDVEPGKGPSEGPDDDSGDSPPEPPTPKETPTESPEDAPVETPDETPEEQPVDTPEDSPEETPEEDPTSGFFLEGLARPATSPIIAPPKHRGVEQSGSSSGS